MLNKTLKFVKHITACWQSKTNMCSQPRNASLGDSKEGLPRCSCQQALRLPSLPGTALGGQLFVDDRQRERGAEPHRQGPPVRERQHDLPRDGLGLGVDPKVALAVDDLLDRSDADATSAWVIMDSEF